MKQINLKITGESPLLMSCDRLADPLDEATIAHKKLTGVRSKTEEVHIAIAKSQYINSLYHDGEKAFIPGINIKRTIEEGAKLTKSGDKIRKGIIINTDKVKLEYGKNLTPDQLWKSNEYCDRRAVVVSRARVQCYRPKFEEWSLVLSLYLDDEILNVDDLVNYATKAGQYIGLGGFRPAKSGHFGRFSVELMDVANVE